MRVYIIYALLLLIATNVGGQSNFSAFNTYYDDSFTEWEIYSSEDQVGTIEMKWKLKNDWTEWDVAIGDYYGNIKVKWDNNPYHWEFRINNEIIDIKTVYPRDDSEWRINDGNTELRLRSKYKNTNDEWTVDHKKYGFLDIYTAWEGDPRDWEINDGLDEAIGPEIKIAMIFIAILHSSPKF